MADAARSVRDDVLVLCHGGPIAEPADVAEVFRTPAGSPASSAPAASSGSRPSRPSSTRSGLRVYRTATERQG